MKFRIRTFSLRYSGEDADVDKVGVIETVFKSELEFVACGKRWQLLIDADGAKIGNDSQNAPGLFTFLALSGGGRLRWRGLTDARG